MGTRTGSPFVANQAKQLWGRYRCGDGQPACCGSHDYHSELDFQAMPSGYEWDAASREVAGSSVYSVANPPDATPSQNRSFESRRGMRVSGHMGGRGNRVTEAAMRQQENRERKLPEARRLQAQGYGYSMIGKRLNEKKATIQKWLRMPPETVSTGPLPYTPSQEGLR